MAHKLRYSEFEDRINIDALEEAVGFTPEYQRGDNDVGYCIWPENHTHGDTTGKFAIEREERLYNCYVCGGGDLLSLAMEFTKLDVDEAAAWLYQFCEDDLRTDSQFLDDFSNAFADVEKRVESLPFFNERVLTQFSDDLRDAEEWVGDDETGGWKPFLENRGIDLDIAQAYGLRYKDEMQRRPPKAEKFKDKEPYFGPGIIFPHFWKGRLVGWQTRWLDPDRPDWLPKYTNTTDFPRDTTIYGWDHVFTHRSLFDKVYVIESAPSVLFLESYGYPSVATFGSNTNEAQLRLLRRFDGVVLIPDHDVPKKAGGKPAGEKWRDALTAYLTDYTDVWWLPPVGSEPGSDIGDFSKERDPREALKIYFRQMYQPGIDL